MNGNTFSEKWRKVLPLSARLNNFTSLSSLIIILPSHCWRGRMKEQRKTEKKN
jgi:hypothetical protein